MKDILIVFFCLIVIGVFCSGFIRQYLFEKREWNNGICKKNDIPWAKKLSDDGVIVYKAENETIRITFRSIDKKR